MQGLSFVRPRAYQLYIKRTFDICLKLFLRGDKHRIYSHLTFDTPAEVKLSLYLCVNS